MQKKALKLGELARLMGRVRDQFPDCLFQLGNASRGRPWVSPGHVGSVLGAVASLVETLLTCPSALWANGEVGRDTDGPHA